MDMENKEYIEDLIKNLRTDDNAPKELLQFFAGPMYNEAKLYISDREKARNTCIEAFSHMYLALSNAKAEDVEDILKKAVQDECIRTAVVEESDTVYTPEDEVPDEEVIVPQDIKKIYSTLKGILGRMTPAQRIIAVLKYRDGLSFSTIANKLNIEESAVKGILQDAKNSLNDSNVDMGMVFALINRAFPYYKAEEPSESSFVLTKDLSALKNQELTEEEQFNTTLSEIKDFFNTAAVAAQTGSEHDDTDQDLSDFDDKTMELQAIVDDDPEYEADEIGKSFFKSPKAVNDPIVYWGKRIAIVLALLVVGFAIAIGVSALRSRKSTPVNTPEPTETTEIEEIEEPTPTPEIEETPEPDDGIIGSAHVMVTDLTIRKGPGVSYEQNGITEYDATYDVYEIAEADGYTWYKVAEDQWVADYLGQYVTYTSKE